MFKNLSDEKLRLASEFFKRYSVEFVEKKLLEWIDTQVEAGKYTDRSDAIETLIRKEIMRTRCMHAHKENKRRIH